MATEEDRQEERGRLGNDPWEAPPAEQLEEENPVESPAADQDDDTEPAEHDSPQERASMSMETGGQVAKSTEGQTVGGTDKTPDAGRSRARGGRSRPLGPLD
jgi:hypothetical protein